VIIRTFSLWTQFKTTKPDDSRKRGRQKENRATDKSCAAPIRRE
jgi:hypothetical protein